MQPEQQNVLLSDLLRRILAEGLEEASNETTSHSKPCAEMIMHFKETEQDLYSLSRDFLPNIA